MEVKKSDSYKFKRFFLFIINLLIWSLMLIFWAIIFLKYYKSELRIDFYSGRGYILIFAFYGLVNFLFTSFYGGYRIGDYRRIDVILSSTLAMVFTNAIIYLQTSLTMYKMVSVKPMLLLSVIDFLIIIIWSFVANKTYYYLYPPREILLIYGGKSMTEDLIQKVVKRSEKYTLCESVSTETNMKNIEEKINKYKAILISDVSSVYRNYILKYAYEKGIRIYLTPKISDIIIRGAKEIELFDTPIFLVKSSGLTGIQRGIKRGVDIIISTLGIIFTFIIMLLTAIAIKIEDNGPILYKQKRYTKDKKIFEIIKFRSMVINAEDKTGITLATKEDDRITKVGKFIRATRIDELPQLFNIFIGQMSVVGPRPERPEIAKEYEKEIKEFNYRLKVKAGLTGYAQVIGKYNTTPYDKLKMDMMYISNYAGWTDIKIMLMTVKIFFKKESTEGIMKEEEKTEPPM